MKSAPGFILLENMLVVSIVALLGTIAIPSFMSSRESTWKQLCLENQSLIADMLDLYCLDNSTAPLTSNFGSLSVVRDALVPVNPDDRYIIHRDVFECPSSGDGNQNDYNLMSSEGMIFGVACNVLERHNE